MQEWRLTLSTIKMIKEKVGPKLHGQINHYKNAIDYKSVAVPILLDYIEHLENELLNEKLPDSPKTFDGESSERAFTKSCCDVFRRRVLGIPFVDIRESEEWLTDLINYSEKNS